MEENNELLTAQKLAKKLDLSVDTIWKYTREDKIPYIKLGNRQYRYNLEEVLTALSGEKVKEQREKYQTQQSTNDIPGNNENFTYRDYLELPEEPGYHYEVLEGNLIKEPSPNVIHQRVSRRLQRMLEDYIWEKDPDGEIFNAPLDVTFGEINVLQPDLLYIQGEDQNLIKEKRIDGPPLLVVEIISPSSGGRDRVQKMNIYKKAGVKHYWIVDPEKKTCECFTLKNDEYTLTLSGMEDDVIEHPEFPDLKIPLKTLWQGRRKAE
ncbi:MAG: Uma2 family endonuclease [Halanaerobiales bacterium]